MGDQGRQTPHEGGTSPYVARPFLFSLLCSVFGIWCFFSFQVSARMMSLFTAWAGYFFAAGIILGHVSCSVVSLTLAN